MMRTIKREEDTWYVYQWSSARGDRWLLKDRTVDEVLARNLFSIRCQHWRDSRVVLMLGEIIVAERGVYDGDLAYPVMP